VQAGEVDGCKNVRDFGRGDVELQALVNLVSIKAPTARMPLPREALELLDAALGIVAAQR
jgi:hypothetical protein